MAEPGRRETYCPEHRQWRGEASREPAASTGIVHSILQLPSNRLSHSSGTATRFATLCDLLKELPKQGPFRLMPVLKVTVFLSRKGRVFVCPEEEEEKAQKRSAFLSSRISRNQPISKQDPEQTSQGFPI
jgi:hypothetical protein